MIKLLQYMIYVAMKITAMAFRLLFIPYMYIMFTAVDIATEYEDSERLKETLKTNNEAFVGAIKEIYKIKPIR